MAFLFYFDPVKQIVINGKLVPAGQPVLMTDNHGYRYGDGLFETMKVENGRILLASYHFERLFSGIRLLGYNIPDGLNPDRLAEEIHTLCHVNNIPQRARVRLSVSRGSGNPDEGHLSAQYLIECSALDNTAQQKEQGLRIDVFPDARKSCDMFSNLKSANYLPYVMAANYARHNMLDESLVLNQFGRIAESSISNVFLVKDDRLITPSLPEGCVAGVVRKYIIANTPATQINLLEGKVTVDDLEQADEVFLTNAIRGIRWVKQFRDKVYTSSRTTEIFRALVQTISD